MTALDLAVQGAQASAPAGVIGPNSILQTVEALRAAAGTEGLRTVFAEAGLLRLLDDPPAEMIDERAPKALFAALWRVFPDDQARAIAHDAGRLTGGYILANRIPAPARALLKALPAALSGPILLKAIEKSAWTFAGSGVCTTKAGRPHVVTIAANPIAMPDCVWHRGVFEALFGALVSPKVRVAHVACGYGRPDTPCRFEISIGQ